MVIHLWTVIDPVRSKFKANANLVLNYIDCVINAEC